MIRKENLIDFAENTSPDTREEVAGLLEQFAGEEEFINVFDFVLWVLHPAVCRKLKNPEGVIDVVRQMIVVF